MATVFEYQARTKKGEKVTGTLEADSSNQAARQLREKGLYVTSISEKKSSRELGDISKYLKLTRRVKTKDLAFFSQQFAAMIDAGISLVEALNILEDQTEHPRLKEVLGAIEEDVTTGTGLSESMMKYSDVFPNLYCQMVRAGESGGVLDQVLNQLANHYEKQEEINGKIRSALYYPVTILIVAIVVVIFLITNVVPTFVGIFASTGGTLPLPTRILLQISEFMQNYWWALLSAFALILFGLSSYKKKPTGAYQFDRLILKIPLIGGMMKKVYLSRFTSTLAILLSSGVDLLSALTIVEDVINNRIYAEVLVEARTQVREGVVFSKPLSESGLFPSMVVQMIRVGEEAGALEKMLYKITEFYDREVEASVESTISMIEPVMIVFLAIIVGFIVISIVLPMFDMFQYF